MPNCPNCNTPGAYVGFSTVECRNPDCSHFVVFEEKICPCCGKVGHEPELAESTPDYSSGSVQINGGDPSLDASDSNDADSAGQCTV